MKVKSQSEVAQLCPTLSDPMDCSLPGSSFHGIFQARVLEWGAIAFSGKKTGKQINDSTMASWRFSLCCLDWDWVQYVFIYIIIIFFVSDTVLNAGLFNT